MEDCKMCLQCKNILPLEDFSKGKRGLLGRKSKCKTCIGIYNASYHKKRYKSDKKYRERQIKNAYKWSAANPEKRASIAKNRNKKAQKFNPEKIRCRALVNQRVRFNRIPKASDLSCFDCGQPAKHYHHYKGYEFENRYDVLPICTRCHVIHG